MTFDPQVTEESAVDTIKQVKKLKSTSWLVGGVSRRAVVHLYVGEGAVVHLYVGEGQWCTCMWGRGSGAPVCGGGGSGAPVCGGGGSGAPVCGGGGGGSGAHGGREGQWCTCMWSVGGFHDWKAAAGVWWS